MKEYAIYCLAEGIRLVAAEWIEASDDDEALATAATMRRGVKREVWQGDRMVGQIEMDPGAEAIG